MGNMTRCLAILVVATMFLCSGCLLAAGPQGCKYGVQGFSCAPPPDGSGDGGDVSSYDGGSTDTDTVVQNDTIGVETTTACKLAGIVDGTWTADGVNKFQVKSERGSADGLCYVVFIDWDVSLEKDVKMADNDHMNACFSSGDCINFTRVK